MAALIMQAVTFPALGALEVVAQAALQQQQPLALPIRVAVVVVQEALELHQVRAVLVSSSSAIQTLMTQHLPRRDRLLLQ